MAKKAQMAVKFDRVNKSRLKLTGNCTRTGADAGRNRQRAHGRARRKG